MTSAKPFFNCTCRLSISMFLPNIGHFLHYSRTSGMLSSDKPFFNYPCRLSISMFLQNISPIRLSITTLGLKELVKFSSNFTQITQWKMIAPKPFFILTWSMSISMILQNFSSIRCFRHNKWPLLREDKNPPRFLLNRVPEQITETNV